jgi:ABC-type multidrug transport system ATPase subunit
MPGGPRRGHPGQVIEANELTKRYGRTTAVQDLTFTVRPGHVTGFLGPNGAGKSTTLRLMLGLNSPTAGTVTIDGRPFRDRTRGLRHVGAADLTAGYASLEDAFMELTAASADYNSADYNSADYIARGNR